MPLTCRGLEAMLTQRRALLQYMRRHDFDTYAITLSRLDLKDNFAKQVRSHRLCHMSCGACVQRQSWCSAEHAPGLCQHALAESAPATMRRRLFTLRYRMGKLRVFLVPFRR